MSTFDITSCLLFNDEFLSARMVRVFSVLFFRFPDTFYLYLAVYAVGAYEKFLTNRPNRFNQPQTWPHYNLSTCHRYQPSLRKIIDEPEPDQQEPVPDQQEPESDYNAMTRAIVESMRARLQRK